MWLSHVTCNGDERLITNHHIAITYVSLESGQVIELFKTCQDNLELKSKTTTSGA
jgi:hypothetical protein